MPQPTASVDATDIDRLLSRDYPAADVPALRGLIEALEVCERNRVVAACLKNAGGKSSQLRIELDDAPGYYREILAQAEYPSATARWGAIERLSEAAKQEIYDSDWRQYQEWFLRA